MDQFAPAQPLAVAARDHQDRPGAAMRQQVVGRGHRGQIAAPREVGILKEAVEQRPACRRPIQVDDRHADMLHIEGERIAVEGQQQRRNQQQLSQRQAVAADLAELFLEDGEEAAEHGFIGFGVWVDWGSGIGDW